MKERKLKRFVSFVLIVNILITMPFVVGATPPQTSNKHYRSYSESGKSKMSLDEITDNKKFEEYRKKGYEDGFNNVLVKPFVPRRYRKAYEEEYKRGQEEYRKKIQEAAENTEKSRDKADITKAQENMSENKTCSDINSKEQETDNKMFEEYRKKGYEDGFNNVLVKPFVPRRYRKAYEEEYKRGKEEYRKKIQEAEKKAEKSSDKADITKKQENMSENKICNDINSKEKEMFNKRVEEYKKKGYEDGFNNVEIKKYVPRTYRKVYEEEYKRGQEEYRKKIQEAEKKAEKSSDKSDITKKQENVSENKICNDINSKEKEMFNKRLEEYKKKGYEDGFNNIEVKKYVPREYRKAYEEEYKRGQEEYRKKAIGKFGYEDGIKNCNFMENFKKLPKAYKAVYESEYINGLLIYIKEHLKSLMTEFGKELPKTEQQAKELGIIHGLNNDQYRIGASENIQKEYRQAYFFAQKIRLKNQGYREAIKNINKKTLKKIFIIKLYGQWYNKGLKCGKEEYMKKLEDLKKQGYIDGLKKHVMIKNIPAELESIYTTEYERGREKYIKKVIERFRKHELKVREKYGQKSNS